MPECSIIMTSYNYSRYISEAIDSVLAQSFSDWELIVVDDGSTDNSIEIINTYVEKFPEKVFLFTHRNNINLGIKSSYELAFTKVKGKYIAFLESDDCWHSQCLEKKIEAMNKFPECSLVYSDLMLIGNNLDKNNRYEDYLKYCRFVGKKLSKTPQDIYNILLLRNPIVSFSNIVIRKDVLEYIILLEEHQIWSDWQLLIQASLKGKFFYIRDKLVLWRIHSESYNFKYMKNNDTKKEGALFKVDLNIIIKDRIDKNDNDKVIRYLYYPNTITYKIWQFFHNIRFAVYSPITVIKEIIRK